MIEGSYLSTNGYCIPKTNIKTQQLNAIKKELTVIPLNVDNTAEEKEKAKYKIYSITTDEIIRIPRYYGIQKFGLPVETRYKKNKPAKIKFNGTLRDYQIPIVDACLAHIKDKGGGLLVVPCASGKCLAKGTPIIMYDGTTKKVEDIVIGDQIMGDDSTPRNILSLARGQEEMFDIIPTKGEKYTVNKSHILSLKWGTERSENLLGIKRSKDNIIDISVEDYLNLPKMFNNSRASPLRGYRVGIDFPEKDVTIDPYFLGLWLGDGTSANTNITNIDKEVIDFSRDHAEKLDLNFNALANEYAYSTIAKKENQNILLEALRKLNLINNKHVPDIYKFNSREVRLQVLAGLIDTDGHLLKNEFDIVQKNETLANDIVFLARSLGFACYKKKCTNEKNPNHQGIYYRMNIHGNTDKIPTKIPRKQATQRTGIKNVLNYGITVKFVGMGDYYGFEIDGNHRFVLGDFTVTHNTSMSIYIASILKAKTLVITHKTFLQEQWIARCKQFTNSSIGIIRQNKVEVEGNDFVVAMIQSLAKRKYDPAIFKQFDFVICDETHHFSSRCFSQALAKCSAKYTMGLTATPYRGDGLMHVVNWFLGDIMYEKRIKTNNQVVTKIITFTCNDPLFKEKKRWIKGKIRPDCVKMIGNLIQISQRNSHIVNIINSLRRTGERKILILSDRKEHLKELKTAVDLSIEQDIAEELVDGDENKTYFYTGDTKKNERFEAEQYADILFATFQMAQEGLDIDRLNTVILATPKPDVNQAVGRVLRKVLENGDVRPLVIDIVDKLGVFVRQSEKREAFYEKSKYVSQYYYMLNDKFISPYEHLKICGEKNENLSKDVPANFDEILEVPPVDIEDATEEPDPVSEESEKKPKKRGKQVKKYVDDDVCMF